METQMQNIMNKVEALVSDYESALLERGIACSVSKRYFEAKTQKPLHNNRSLLDVLFRRMAEKRENEKFHHQRNRTHCVVLRFVPTDTKLVKKAECREYAYILSEISRPEEGFAPKDKAHCEERILRKIEKRILRILRKAEKKNAVEVCRCTKADVARYFFLSPYGYMKKLAGYDRDTLDIVITAIVLAFFIAVLMLIFCK